VVIIIILLSYIVIGRYEENKKNMHFEVLGSKTYKSETLFAGFVKFGYGALVESFVLVI